METWLLLTAYKKSPTPYLMVPSPTPYNLPFSHSTSVTDKRTTHGQRTTTMPIARPLLKYGQLKTRITSPDGGICLQAASQTRILSR